MMLGALRLYLQLFNNYLFHLCHFVSCWLSLNCCILFKKIRLHATKSLLKFTFIESLLLLLYRIL